MIERGYIIWRVCVEMDRKVLPWKTNSGIDDKRFVNNDCIIDPSVGGGKEPKVSWGEWLWTYVQF
jgi:hypothetical protein